MDLVATMVILSWSWTVTRSAGAILIDASPDPALAQKISSRLEQGSERLPRNSSSAEPRWSNAILTHGDSPPLIGARKFIAFPQSKRKNCRKTSSKRNMTEFGSDKRHAASLRDAISRFETASSVEEVQQLLHQSARHLTGAWHSSGDARGGFLPLRR